MVPVRNQDSVLVADSVVAEALLPAGRGAALHDMSAVWANSMALLSLPAGSGVSIE